MHYDEHVEVWRTLMPSFVAFSSVLGTMVTESDYSVTITGHVVCLVALSGFDLMPLEGHSVLEDIPCRRGADQSTVGTISHYR